MLHEQLKGILGPLSLEPVAFGKTLKRQERILKHLQRKRTVLLGNAVTPTEKLIPGMMVVQFPTRQRLRQMTTTQLRDAIEICTSIEQVLNFREAFEKEVIKNRQAIPISPTWDIFANPVRRRIDMQDIYLRPLFEKELQWRQKRGEAI
jgi:hypothetical protein